MNEKQDLYLRGRLRLYMQWPVVMSIVLIGMGIWIYFMDHRAGRIMGVAVLLYLIVTGGLYLYCKATVTRTLVEFAEQFGHAQERMLKEMGIPYAILADTGRILWMNNEFRAVLGDKYRPESNLVKYMKEINRGVFPKEDLEKVQIEIPYEDKEFQAELQRIPVKEMEEQIGHSDSQEYYIAVCLRDITELNKYIQANEHQRLVAGLVYIDNYDEVIESVEEVRQSLLIALIERKINQYFSRVSGIVKRLETDKYFVVMTKQDFRKLEEDRFSILEDVKTISVGNKIPATLGIGLGISRESYSQSHNYARVAIDQALARGGDQVVIKDCSGITYYGGKREMTSKNTRVKARVKAEALREYMLTGDCILVMGHRMPDVDCLGAAVGMYRAAVAVGKTAHIVLEDPTAAVRALYNDFVQSTEYPEDLFVSPEEAIEMADERSMVIVVDTNRPQMTECPPLLQRTKTIAVLDHHRQSSDNIENAMLSYIEPYASSACEMVSEILQYIADDVKLPAIEASSMYAGIMLDTNNFTCRTGVRTFEAAAFLRRCGADIPYVRKIFRDDMESYRAKASIISSAEVYRKKFAIARCGNLKVDAPTIIGAQAANELLEIDGICASFVATVYNGKIYVSARSIDEVNVQIIMERLGGGGHLNASGGQFAGMGLDEVVRRVKEQIDRMIEEGDI